MDSFLRDVTVRVSHRLSQAGLLPQCKGFAGLELILRTGGGCPIRLTPSSTFRPIGKRIFKFCSECLLFSALNYDSPIFLKESEWIEIENFFFFIKWITHAILEWELLVG